MVASLAEARSHSITPEEFLRFDGELRTAKREKDDAGAELSRAKKTAKNGAVDLRAYKFIEQMRRLDDDEQIVVVRHIVQYLQWLEMPVGTQFSMIDAPQVPNPKAKAKAEHNVFLAGEAGLKAGRDGEPATANPFVAGTEQHVVFAQKHADGLLERATAARMQDDDTGPVADAGTATNGRGRGRGRGRRTAAANGEMALDNARRHLGETPVH
jgi:hypothetical protein